MNGDKEDTIIDGIKIDLNYEETKRVTENMIEYRPALGQNTVILFYELLLL